MNVSTNLLEIYYFYKRNKNVLITKFRSKIDEFMIYLQNSTNSLISDLTVSKKSFLYLDDQLNKIGNVLEGFSIKQTNYQQTIKEINNSIYIYYRDQINKLLIQSTEVYRGTILSFLQKKLSQDLLDISGYIIETCKLLTNVKTFDDNIFIYLLNDINMYYRNILDTDKLTNLSQDIFTQIILDIYHIKESMMDKSVLFTEVEHKAKFLAGDILDETNFVSQFKLYYHVHNVNILKKILKYKHVDQRKTDKILKLYQHPN